jgi:amidophosphoribosyltransferase
MQSTEQKSIREKCGIVGVWTEDVHANYLTRRALAALQHRGQESAGLSILNPNGIIETYKDMGLVPNVLTEDVLKRLGNGHMAIGHNRYATFGKSSVKNAQPIVVSDNQYQISIAHNGNIPSVNNIKKQLTIDTTVMGDTELMAQLLLKNRSAYMTWEETLVATLPQFHGAYCLMMLTNKASLFGIRDPYGIRPLCLGKRDNDWVMASESAALDSVGADFVREVMPGEIIMISKHGELTSFFFGEPKRKQSCLFECIYFARPDSFMNGQRIRAGREASGKLLGKRMKEKKIKPDVVVPTFDSGYPAAKGVALELQLPSVDAITTSHYVGRTFIQPGQTNRISAVNGKHNIVPDEIIDKKVVIVDDSLVRSTTSSALIKKMREAGANEIYLGIASPPVVDQCDLGIDMRAKNELPAAQFEKESLESIEQKIAKHIGADAVIYLPIDEIAKAMGNKKEQFYYTPFGGPHPIRGKQDAFPRKEKKLRGKPKICILLSGKGTYVQDIIDGIAAETIDAEIVSIVSNKKEAYGVIRAQEHKIQTAIMEYTGKLSDQAAREQYEQQLVDYIHECMPDMIFLSGWQMILGKTFLQAMQELHIPIFNHHPALLTSTNEETIATSRGVIPVLRGKNAEKEAYERHLHVTGITVHQVLLGEIVDMGPVVMKAEVRILAGETYESLQGRMNEAEHQLVPSAIKRILHVLKHNVDVSQGSFPWE